MEIPAYLEIRTHGDDAECCAHELGVVAADGHPDFLSAEVLAGKLKTTAGTHGVRLYES